MTIYRVRGFAELYAAIQKNEAARLRRVHVAAFITSIDGVRVARKYVPRAFGELEESIHAEHRPTGAATIADAPHAEAVEKGSRPHWVPLAALIRWVKLRGTQGLSKRPKQLRGATTRAHAMNVAAQLKAYERHGSLSIDVPETIARAIQAAIAKRGTKPHWFMRQSLPEIMKALDKHIHKALPPSAGG